MVKKSDTVVKVTNPNIVVIIGDIHGHFSDLMEVINHNGMPSKNKPYIFLSQNNVI